MSLIFSQLSVATYFMPVIKQQKCQFGLESNALVHPKRFKDSSSTLSLGWIAQNVLSTSKGRPFRYRVLKLMSVLLTTGALRLLQGHIKFSGYIPFYFWCKSYFLSNSYGGCYWFNMNKPAEPFIHSSRLISWFKFQISMFY